MSIAACGPNVSPTFGPVFGGILAEKAGWPWIFWLLAMLASISLALIILFYPETSRNIVGNGSIPAHGLNRRATDIFWPSSLAKKSTLHTTSQTQAQIPEPFAQFHPLPETLQHPTNAHLRPLLHRLLHPPSLSLHSLHPIAS